MRIKKACEVTLWLPGFGPDDNAQDVLDVINISSEVVAVAAPCVEEAVQPVVVSVLPEVVARSKPVKAEPWPAIDASFLETLSGDVTKFNANADALRLLATLEAEGRTVTPAERVQLNSYTGWGGLPKVFDRNQQDESWQSRNAELRQLLSTEEYVSAEDSTLNAHFTPPAVIRWMWDLARQLGFKGGKVLEPAAGGGYFLASMPDDIKQASEVSAVELDRVSARILKALYGRHGVQIHQKGFEATNFPDDYFDLVVGNVPFGNYSVPELRNVPYSNFLIHDYFIAKSLDLVRPGGLVLFVTSSGTMDKYEDSVRQYVAGKANLLGAVRLPSSTFKSIANTEVVADVLVLQKFDVGAPKVQSHEWMGYVEAPRDISNERHIIINRYWPEHQSHVLGRLGYKNTMYGRSLTCLAPENQVLADVLAGLASNFPTDAYKALEKKVDVAEWMPRRVQLEEGTRAGYVLVDGVVMESDGFQAFEVKAPAKTLERIKMLCKIRDAARKLIKAQVTTISDDILETYRVSLGVAYSNFTATFGPINEKLNRRAFKDDPDLPLLLSLEHWDSKKGIAKPAEIFSRRTVMAYREVDQCATLEDALVVCVAECGRVIMARIAKLVGVSVDHAASYLEDHGLVYVNPKNGMWETADEYLSGNVREKLTLAELSGAEFERNVIALQQVMPRDLGPSEISVRIGSTWVPGSVYVQFLKETFDAKEATVQFHPSVGTWEVSVDFYAERSVKATQELGTRRINGIKLFELAMNLRNPEIVDKDPVTGRYIPNKEESITAREKQAQLQDLFKEWVWADMARVTLLTPIYNALFNSTVPRQYNGTHMPLPGYSWAVQLRRHQLDAIWRVVASKSNTLLGHAVGAGKTLAMICAAMELRRLGKASRPLLAVPNHMLLEFAQEFMRAYPSANILMASKDDLAGDRRRILLSRIATGDYDAVLITHSSFERIPMSPEFLKGHIEDELEQIESAIRASSKDRGSRIVKELARAKKVWTNRLEKLQGKGKKDDVLYFEDLGVDYIFCDEAHLYKNCYRFTKMQRIAGLPNSNSERAFDMLVKTRSIMQKHGSDYGVCMATATFVANSMAELHVFQKYLQPTTLKSLQLDQFDSWASNFGEVVTALEISPDGQGYRVNQRFSKFVNLPDLLSIFSEVADIRTTEMLDLPTPEIKHETIAIEPTDTLMEFVKGLVKRAEKIRGGGVRPNEDNMLAVTGDGRNAALDVRLMGLPVVEGEKQKVDVCADRVFSIWQDTIEKKSTQLIFCDAGTPSGNARFNVYEELRRQLVLKGIPKDEVAFIHEHDATDATKEALFSRVREGSVRVLVGSTSKLGVGTNIQRKLVALHHLDAPWRPADVEQRDGRIARQGNENEAVFIFRYITKKSFDAYSWQVLETKARFIAQVLKGDSGLRTIEDVESTALSFAELKAIASGNPLVLEKAGVDSDLAKLTLMFSEWKRNLWNNRRSLVDIPTEINRENDLIDAHRKDIALRDARKGKSFEAVIDGQYYSSPLAAVKAIAPLTTKMGSGEKRILGTWDGFQLIASPSYDGKVITLKANMSYAAFMGRSHDGLAEVLFGALNSIEEKIDDRQSRIKVLEKTLADVKVAVDRPFEHEERLKYLVQRQRELEDALDLGKGINQVDDVVEQELVAA